MTASPLSSLEGEICQPETEIHAAKPGLRERNLRHRAPLPAPTELRHTQDSHGSCNHSSEFLFSYGRDMPPNDLFWGEGGCHMRFLEQNFLGCGLQESSSINARNLFFTVRSIKGNAGIREPGFSTEDAHRVHLDTLTLQVASGPLGLLSHLIPMGLLIKT